MAMPLTVAAAASFTAAAGAGAAAALVLSSELQALRTSSDRALASRIRELLFIIFKNLGLNYVLSAPMPAASNLLSE